MNITNLILVGSGSICERFVWEEKADITGREEAANKNTGRLLNRFMFMQV